MRTYKEVSGSWLEFGPGKYDVVGSEGKPSQTTAGTGENKGETNGTEIRRKTVVKLPQMTPPPP